jgi:hypothetical protein
VSGSRARESNGSIGNGSETTIVIGKMFAEEIEVMNGKGVLGLQNLHNQTSTETATIETGEIGNGPIVGGRTVIDPIASGNQALRGRRYHAIETATVETVKIGNARIVGIPIVTDRTALGSPTPQDRRYPVTETVTVGTEKTGSALIEGRIVKAQIGSGSPVRRDREYRATEIATVGVEEIGNVLIVTPRIVSSRIESDAPARQGQKHGRMIKMGSGRNQESGGARKARELP